MEEPHIPTDEERAAERRKLNSLTKQQRFQLLFGHPLSPPIPTEFMPHKTQTKHDEMKPTTEVQRLLNTLEAGEVERFHCVPSIPAQTVAAHSWGVAMVMRYIIGEHIHSRPLLEALNHDTGELLTGDIPFTAKRGCLSSMRPQLDAAEEAVINEFMMVKPAILTLRVSTVLKLSDMLEGMRWASLNERGAIPVVALRWWDALRDMFRSSDIFELSDTERQRAWEAFVALAPGGRGQSEYTTFKDFEAIQFRDGRPDHTKP